MRGFSVSPVADQRRVVRVGANGASKGTQESCEFRRIATRFSRQVGSCHGSEVVAISGLGVLSRAAGVGWPATTAQEIRDTAKAGVAPGRGRRLTCEHCCERDSTCGFLGLEQAHRRHLDPGDAHRAGVAGRVVGRRGGAGENQTACLPAADRLPPGRRSTRPAPAATRRSGEGVTVEENRGVCQRCGAQRWVRVQPDRRPGRQACRRRLAAPSGLPARRRR